MPEIGWIIFAAVLVGPVLLGILLRRLGFSRAVSVGLGSTIVGAAILLREPMVTSNADRSAATPAEISPRAEPATTDELHDLRRQVSTFPSERRQTQPHDSGEAAAALARETAAHKEMTLALKAAKEKLEASVEAQRRLAAELEAARRGQNANTELEDTRRRLAIAEATIARLEAAAQAAPARTSAVDPLFAPAPFSAVRSEPQPAEPHPPAANVATGATDASVKTDADDKTPLGASLSQASQARQFELTRIDDNELIEGRRGSYYRITCPDGVGGNRLRFEAGGYQLEGGERALAGCLEAIRKMILSPLPAAAAPRLYVQGFASTPGFQNARRLDPRNPSLKSITYLPRKSGTDRFVTRPKRSNLGGRYTNADLPNLRAALVASAIVSATKNGIRPEILEGQLRPGSNPSSRSFDLILQTAW